MRHAGIMAGVGTHKDGPGCVAAPRSVDDPINLHEAAGVHPTLRSIHPMILGLGA